MALTQFWFQPWFAILAIAICIGFLGLLIRDNKTYNANYVSAEATNFNLATGRLLFLFASFIPPLTALVYCLIIGKIDVTLYVNTTFG
ncbi:MAG: hypothetical protein ABL940_10970, partial [Bacteroidia bacterium]